MSDVAIYQTADGATSLQVQLNQETVWLTQAQLAKLFEVKIPAVNKHLKNIITSGELTEDAVISILETTAADGKEYKTRHYSLDAIIAVGYRVNSFQATRFRQWATRILRSHIVNGYTVNEQRLREESAKLREMLQTMELLARTLTSHELVTATGKDVLAVITDYAYALTLLDRYDHGTLTIEGLSGELHYAIDYDEGIAIVAGMKGKFDGLFGFEKDQGFKSALSTIYQTFDGKELYPSVEEKAANLLYFIVKNHAFSDGNKRIAAALFIYFLGMNGILYRPDGGKRLADNALVALTLLIAESRPEEKGTIVKVIVSLINRKN